MPGEADPFALTYLNNSTDGVELNDEPTKLLDFEHDPDAAFILLSKGMYTMIDAVDYDLVNQFMWTVNVQRVNRYAYRRPTVHGRRTVVYLHRWIMSAPLGTVVDHINGNGLDNRRSNLRITDYSGNNYNRPSCSASGFHGVYKERKRWRCRITVSSGVRVHLGMFDSPEEAARVYDEEARKVHGVNAVLNFKEEVDEIRCSSEQGSDIPF